MDFAATFNDILHEIAPGLTKQAAADMEVSKHWIGGAPMTRLGQPGAIASVILFLPGGASSLMTGRW